MAQAAQDGDLKAALSGGRQFFAAIGLFSLFINLLMLVSPLYMLQIYDRVLTSRSEDTLVFLTILAVGLIATSAFLELVRNRLLVRLGARIDTQINERVFSAMLDQRVRRPAGGSAQPLRDMETVRGFLTGGGLPGFFDMPWTPIFLFVLFLFHPLLGAIALVGAILLFGLALISEWTARAPQRHAAAASQQAHAFTESALRNAEVVRALGMLPDLRRRWLVHHATGLAYQGRAGDRAGLLTALAKFLRPVLQISMLGVGAYLVLQEAITPGVMVAGSIIMGRALAPVEASLGNWRTFVAARAAYGRIKALLASHPAPPARLALPKPLGHLKVEGAVAVPPGGGKPVLQGLSFESAPGALLGVIGPSAAGKSCLARLLTGVWAPAAGHVRLDGAELGSWPPERLGPHIGYLPQDVELFDGTVAENIARFGVPNDATTVAAARQAGAHEMILRLADGYDTRIGERGAALSGGQRQRIALARALYGSPVLIVLDEPNASLDGEGEQALLETLQRLKTAKRTVVVIAHRPNILTIVDKVLLLRAGRIEAFGPKAEVLPRLIQPVRSAPQTPVATLGGIGVGPVAQR